ncbi:MAG: CHAT domain-containing protein [Thermomicrobiales bacterium]
MRSGDEVPLLPGTGREVLGISSLIASATGESVPAVCLLGSQATRQATVPLIPAAKLVHLATHGAFAGEDGGLSSVQDFLLLFSPTSDGSHDTLAMRELFEARLPLDDVFQVILAACHLGRVVLQGDEAMGFNQAFLSAGPVSSLPHCGLSMTPPPAS